MAPTTQPRQLFLQALLSQPSLSYEKALSLHQRCLEICYDADPESNEKPPRKADPTKFAEFKDALNDKLEGLGLVIRDSVLQEYRVKEQDGTRINEVVKWMSLINTVSDTLAQAATSYSPMEIAYLKLIIEAIIIAPRFAYSISTLSAARLVGDIKKGKGTQPFSNKQAEKLLERFCGNDGEGWLVRSDRGRYSLSPRSLSELEDYLKETYGPKPPQDGDNNDELDAPPVLLLCELDRCRKLVTLGLLCPNCSSHGIHGSCKAAVLRKQEPTCPCGEVWSNETDWLPVGEGAVRDGEDEQRGRKRVVRDESDEEEMDMEEEESGDGEESGAAGPSSTRKTRRTTRRSSTVSAAASSTKGKGRASASSPKKKARTSTASSKSKTKSKKKKKVAGLGELSEEDEEEEEEEDQASPFPSSSSTRLVFVFVFADLAFLPSVDVVIGRGGRDGRG
ncbi:Nse1 non-SMC component of SMC5-6 complex-domain-containing protein [Mrakia frigida]|uniref:Nse1 non-SMC component of SMC5-6 complex-domain-containing protein n=1 Tax=Mrakia frigida TaxID=29902 RepID=UPI003FCBFF95